MRYTQAHLKLPDDIYQTSFWGLSYHILMGYVLGKLYLKSKSLTPSIILHLLINQV